jgi:transcriptional regulator with XRE-family HTH domain
MTKKVKVLDVVFREDLYPRINTSAETVQKYAEDLSVLPPIQVNQRMELIDGWHRWTAHKKNGIEEINAIITETASDAELLELAIESNATHGLQLSQSDKRDMARKIYHGTAERDRDEKKKQLAKILSVSDRTIRDWLSRVDKDAKEARDRRIFDLWLACHTTEEIAELVGVDKAEVSRLCCKTAELPNFNKLQQSAAEHATDFDAPIYNIWKQQTKTEGASHFGNSEVRWLDNLLYLYTKPFDVVLDPFGGGGSTIDLCRKRLRRYMVSDRKPIVEREKEIRRHDLKDGALKPPQWKDVALVYLDPPYWKQAEGQYSNDPEDLANMPLEQFNETLAGIIHGYAKKATGAHIALIIQPTQWKAPERQFVDHVGDMLRAVNLPVAMRFSVPYESQQCNAQMVTWAKENRQCLVLTREIVVWSVSK